MKAKKINTILISMFILIVLFCISYYIYFNNFIDDKQLNFLNSIFGSGGLAVIITTLLSIWTEEQNLKYQQEKSEQQAHENLAAQYKPILHINNNITTIENGDDSIIFNLELINSGRGEGNNISFSVIPEKAFDVTLKTNTNILASGEKTNIKIILRKNIEEILKNPNLENFYSTRYTKIDKIDEYIIFLNFPLDNFVMNFTIEYYDLLENKYINTVHTTFTRQVNEIKRFTQDKEYFGTWILENKQDIKLCK